MIEIKNHEDWCVTPYELESLVLHTKDGRLDVDMRKLCGCDSTSLDFCELNCGEYYRCNSVALADDVLCTYEDYMTDLRGGM